MELPRIPPPMPPAPMDDIRAMHAQLIAEQRLTNQLLQQILETLQRSSAIASAP